MHIPVLKKEVLEYLNPKENENFVDCTVGHGGHAKAILEKTGPAGKVLGIDSDLKQIEICQSQLKEFKKRIILASSSYTKIKEIVGKNKFKADGVLLDLGMSSWHLENSERGFSFLKDEPLDMRYDTETNNLTAEEVINNWGQKEIEIILKEYGEERFAKEISQKVIEERKRKPIKTTFQLVEIIKKAVPSQHERIHFATKTFQALRVAVNGELDNLKEVLPQIADVLEKNGRIAIISFHSLEDRIVKSFLKEKVKEGELKILTKKPITPSFEEIKTNPRSRSAKLRAAIKIK